MNVKTLFLAATIGTAATGAAYAQDECASATAAIGGFVPIDFDTSGATDSPEPWPCAVTAGSDIWFSYTPTFTGGSVTVSLCESDYDTVLEGFSGTCGALVSLGCSDDLCGDRSFLEFGPTVAGTPLYLRIGGFDGASGTGTYRLLETARNQGGDECNTAAVLTSGFGSTFDTDSATLSPPAWSCVSFTDKDVWYSYTTTTADALLDVKVFGTGSAGLEIFEGPCGSLTLLECDAFGLIETGVLTGAAGTTYFIRVGNALGAANGTLFVTEIASPCSVPDDSFEPNDACTQASIVAPGFYVGLFASTSSPDFYEITLQPFDELTVILVDPIVEDLDIRTFDASCNLDTAFLGDQITVVNLSGAPEVFRYEVFVNPNSPGFGCLTYNMNVVVTPDTCATFVDDTFEPNDDCASATALGDGTYPGLEIIGDNNDHFAVGVDPGATVSVEIFFAHAELDLDLYLWDPSVICGTDVAGQGPGTGALEVSRTETDNESISYTNSTGVAQDLVFEVTRDDLNVKRCANYELVISGSNGTSVGSLGQRYCAANVNSTGAAARISAAGSGFASDNNVTLSTTAMPTFTFGFYLASRIPDFVPNPGGSDGNLCLGGSIGRYVGPGQVRNSGAVGAVSLVIDLTSVPSPTGPVAVMPGETWNFTTWFRDANTSGTTSNLSDGVSILFF
ncbi:MAG: hypothetical protein AAGA20_05000 [Planctomycetota bacterium]